LKRQPADIYRIIDANRNRVKEALRVCEEVLRFSANNSKLTREIKEIRHRIDSALMRFGENEVLLKHREAYRDVGKFVHPCELQRKTCKDIFFANIQRAKESARVLEEFSKLINKKASGEFKKARYRIYEVEKKAAIRVKAICNLG